MSHRCIEKADFVGKTIADLECDAVNIIRFKFVDGTALAIEVDAVGLGIYGMVACDECAAEYCAEVPQATVVDETALHAAIRVWMYTPIIRLHTVAGKRQDLYLKLVAHAAQLPYEEVVKLWHAQDSGVVDARRKVKSLIFKRLFTDPASILQIHDETVVHEAPVESGDAAEAQGHENRPR